MMHRIRIKILFMCSKLLDFHFLVADTPAATWVLWYRREERRNKLRKAHCKWNFSVSFLLASPCYREKSKKCIWIHQSLPYLLCYGFGSKTKEFIHDLVGFLFCFSISVTLSLSLPLNLSTSTFVPLVFPSFSFKVLVIVQFHRIHLRNW